MVTKAHSLDELTDRIRSALDSMRGGMPSWDDGRVWEFPANPTYYSGSSLIQANGEIPQWIPYQSKTGYYLDQSRKTGTIPDIRSQVEPLASYMQVDIGDWMFHHKQWINVKIFDVGTIGRWSRGSL